MNKLTTPKTQEQIVSGQINKNKFKLMQGLNHGKSGFEEDLSR